MKRNLLKRLNKVLSPNKVDFSSMDNALISFKKKLEETINIQTLEDVSRKLKQFQKSIDTEPIIREINKIKETFAKETKEFQNQIDKKDQELKSIDNLILKNEIVGSEQFKKLRKELFNLKEELRQLRSVHEADVAFLNQTVLEQTSLRQTAIKDIQKLVENINTRSKKEDIEKTLKYIEGRIETLRQDIFNRISQIGGSPNQQINVNSSVMSAKYADFNFLSDTAIRWVATQDDNNKRVNIRASLISGGSGGPGGGITRSVSIISVSSTLAATALTDYIFFTNTGIKITLPTAVDNSNLYTIKNVSSSSILVAANGAETIDGSATVLVALPNEALDFISDNTNFNVV